MKKLYSILVCVLLITTVFAGCIGEVQEGSYSEDVGAEDHDHADHSDHDHGAEDTKKEVPKEQVSSIIAPGVPTFEILSEHPVECVNESNVVDMFIDVFGVYVIAPEDAPIEKVLHTANVLAQYIDNDEDGVPDDPKVLDILVEGGFVAPVWKSDDRDKFWEANRGTPCEDDLRTAAGMYYGSDYGDNWAIGGIEKSYEEKGVPGPWDTNIEEIWHIVSYGWYEAYPEYFGNGDPNSAISHSQNSELGGLDDMPYGQGVLSSKLTVATDAARGGWFEGTPNQYPDDAWYRHRNPTCGYECKVNEYFYWIIMANMDALDPGLTHACEDSKDEWNICTRDELEQKDVLAFELLNDSGFNFPTVIPDGSYRADHDQGEEEVWACCKAMTASCIACSEGLTKQEWLDKTCGPGCTDAIYAGWDEETKKMKWDCIY